ncbi:putative aquaporin SIP2-1 [Datura stramonium]|uniref:Aquaporin SIP2-1 n=1 Tax=Datura stramonium TaxID=4076 RepID=A0ABS8WSD8_DATST|nr:putative aquaporin SIP2-1 [Datura stramonium]
MTKHVFGSITGVRLIIAAFPNTGRGPRLNIDIHQGALIEGCLTFAIVSISLGLSRSSQASTFMKTWISSLSKLTLHILGSDLTGGCMNPASVMGWAYARGDHITKEHIHVYWLAPIQATLLAVWTFNLLFSPPKDEKEKKKEKKSE